MTRRTLMLALAAATVLFAPAPAPAAEDLILYPATVRTIGGRTWDLQSLGHALEEGAFTFYDGAEQSRVSWRDLDKVRFIQNIKHVPGANAQRIPNTERAELFYLDGTIRQVNLVIGRIHGHDGYGERHALPNAISSIDFDEARIAPTVLKSCERGHVFENEDWRFCPFDGLELKAARVR